MHLSRVLSAIFAVCLLSVAGCGGSNETTSVDSGELQSYVEDNAAMLAEEDAQMEAEEAADDADDE